MTDAELDDLILAIRLFALKSQLARKEERLAELEAMDTEIAALSSKPLECHIPPGGGFGLAPSVEPKARPTVDELQEIVANLDVMVIATVPPTSKAVH